MFGTVLNSFSLWLTILSVFLKYNEGAATFECSQQTSWRHLVDRTQLTPKHTCIG